MQPRTGEYTGPPARPGASPRTAPAESRLPPRRSPRGLSSGMSHHAGLVADDGTMRRTTHGTTTEAPVAAALAPMAMLQPAGPSGRHPKKWLTPGVWMTPTSAALETVVARSTTGLLTACDGGLPQLRPHQSGEGDRARSGPGSRGASQEPCAGAASGDSSPQHNLLEQRRAEEASALVQQGLRSPVGGWPQGNCHRREKIGQRVDQQQLTRIEWDAPVRTVPPTMKPTSPRFPPRRMASASRTDAHIDRPSTITSMILEERSSRTTRSAAARAAGAPCWPRAIPYWQDGWRRHRSHRRPSSRLPSPLPAGPSRIRTLCTGRDSSEHDDIPAPSRATRHRPQHRSLRRVTTRCSFRIERSDADRPGRTRVIACDHAPCQRPPSSSCSRPRWLLIAPDRPGRGSPGGTCPRHARCQYPPGPSLFVRPPPRHVQPLARHPLCRGLEPSTVPARQRHPAGGRLPLLASRQDGFRRTLDHHHSTRAASTNHRVNRRVGSNASSPMGCHAPIP